MAIFRGTGGQGDSTTDATVTEVTQQAVNAANSATAAASSASSASTSATNAATSETNASTSATNAATSATNAATSETNAETAKVAAEAAQAAAETAETNAETAETNAETAQTAAEAAQAAAEAAQTAAETAETNAETAEANTLAIFGDAQDVQDAVDSATASATSASNSATTATTQAGIATTKASEAASSATDAQTAQTAAELAETNAETAQTAAETAQTAAETAQTAAETAQTAAETAETNAETAETNASASATSASNSATASANSATAASTSETNAATSATTATTKASEASTSATNAANSATAAQTAQTAAETAQAAAEAAQEAIDGLYLGTATSNPTVDLNGDPVTAGDWYFNTTDNTTRIYDGSAWNTVNPDLVGDSSPQLGGDLDLNSNDITGTGDIDITGNLVADGLTVEGNSTLTANGINTTPLKIYSNSTAENGTTQITLGDTTGGGLYQVPRTNLIAERAGSGFGGRLYIQTRNSSSSDLNRIKIDEAGDISFYDDAGTSQDFYWDASTSRLGLGTTSPAEELHITATTPTIKLEASSGSTYNTQFLNYYNSAKSFEITNGGFSILRSSLQGYSNISIGTDSKARIDISQSDNSIIFNNNTSEAARIDSSGNLLVGTTTSPSDTNTIVASAGIYLGGTGSANLLDDYEEGTFNASFNNEAGDLSATASLSFNRVAMYRKVGSVVYITLSISTSGTITGTASSPVVITGLPFTSNQSGTASLCNVSPSPAAAYNSMSVIPKFLLIGDNVTQGTLFKEGASDDIQVLTSDLAASGNANRIHITGFYFTDS